MQRVLGVRVCVRRAAPYEMAGHACMCAAPSVQAGRTGTVCSVWVMPLLAVITTACPLHVRGGPTLPRLGGCDACGGPEGLTYWGSCALCEGGGGGLLVAIATAPKALCCVSSRCGLRC